MSDEAALREEFVTAFEDADYPVTGQMDLLPALPKGPRTKFEAGDLSFSVMELASKLGSHADFPYEDVESLVDDIMAALVAEGEL
ncbi:MAG: MTH865 family protein [Halodesulfurarchaeum sp.]